MARPVLKLVPQDVLCREFNEPATCNVLGATVDDGDVVWLRQNLDYEHDVFARSTVFHELIHTFQAAAGLRPRTCEAWLAGEREAYALQTKYLERRGAYERANDVRIYIATLGCAREPPAG